jgi:redox-sensitive bicupin YhaK (pirin superfamily)
MINIEKLTDFGFRALLPAGGSAQRSETFTLSGFKTHLTSSNRESRLPPQLRLHFAPLDPELDLAERHGKFSPAERDNILCLLASPDGRFGSLRINAAVQIYTGWLGAGHQITYRIPDGHHLWLRPLAGSLALNGTEVSAGEVARISDESEMRFGGLSDCDCEFILLVLR